MAEEEPAVELNVPGNIGEFLGSLGVLVSLFYLATQIKKSTEAERTATYQAVVSNFGSPIRSWPRGGSA